MRDENVSVVTAIPSGGFWRAETGKAVTLMFSYFAQNRITGVKSQRLSLTTCDSSVIVVNRHIMMKKACQDPRMTHLLFIDADMVFPMNTLHRLLSHDKDVIAANCTTRQDPILPVAFDFDEKRVESWHRTGLQKVRQVGAAVMLIRLDVVRKLRPPFFMSEWIPSMGNYAGEDVYFCQLLQAAGVDVWIDHDLSKEVKHVGHRSYGHEDVKSEDRAHD